MKKVMATEKFKAPTVCPVCGGEYEITTLTCKKCKSELNGRFEGCEFCSLPEGDKVFLRAFIKCRGNIREVEKELGISYPTVRNRLEGLMSRMGLSPRTDPDAVREQRKRIIEQLENGEITAGEAAEKMENLKMS